MSNKVLLFYFIGLLCSNTKVWTIATSVKNFGTHTGVLVPIASLALLEVRQISLLSGTPVGLKKCFKIHGNRNQISYKQHLAKYTKFNFCHNFKVKSGKDGKGLKLENTAFKFGCDLNSKKFQKFNMYHKIHVILSWIFRNVVAFESSKKFHFSTSYDLWTAKLL